MAGCDTARVTAVGGLLAGVELTAVAHKQARTYSGGMKRRLGVANAFIGNPKLVYLDEPSTGLDPESRQQLWRAVNAAMSGNGNASFARLAARLGVFSATGNALKGHEPVAATGPAAWARAKR